MYNCPLQRHTDSSLMHNAVPFNSTSKTTTSVHLDALHAKKTWSVGTQTTNLVSDNCCQTEACRSTYGKRFRDKKSQTMKKLPNVKALSRKIRLLQSKLRKAMSVKRRGMSKSITSADLPHDTKDFFDNQVNNLNRNVIARRYTTNFYKNCFLLYHRSRSCYSFLRQIFFMPSPSRLRHQLQKIFEKVRNLYL